MRILSLALLLVLSVAASAQSPEIIWRKGTVKAPRSIDVSPDGKTMVVAGADAVRAIEVSTGRTKWVSPYGDKSFYDFTDGFVEFLSSDRLVVGGTGGFMGSSVQSLLSVHDGKRLSDLHHSGDGNAHPDERITFVQKNRFIGVSGHPSYLLDLLTGTRYDFRAGLTPFMDSGKAYALESGATWRVYEPGSELAYREWVITDANVISATLVSLGDRAWIASLERRKSNNQLRIALRNPHNGAAQPNFFYPKASSALTADRAGLKCIEIRRRGEQLVFAGFEGMPGSRVGRPIFEAFNISTRASLWFQRGIAESFDSVVAPVPATGGGYWATRQSDILGSASQTWIRRYMENGLYDEMQLPAAPQVAAAWSPDGDTLATAGNDGVIRLYSALGGTQLRTLSIGKGFSVGRLRYSPDGKYLAAGSGNARSQNSTGSWAVWRTSDYSVALKGGTTSSVSTNWRFLSDLEFSPESGRLAVATMVSRDDSSGDLAVYELGTGRRVWRKTSPVPNGIKWSVDGNFLYATGFLQAVKVDARTGTILKSIGEGDEIGLISPDKNSLITVGSRIYRFSLPDFNQKPGSYGLPGMTTSANFSSEGKTLWIGTNGSYDEPWPVVPTRLSVLDAASFVTKLVYTDDIGDWPRGTSNYDYWSHRENGPLGLSFSPDGRHYAFATRLGDITVARNPF